MRRILPAIPMLPQIGKANLARALAESKLKANTEEAQRKAHERARVKLDAASS